MPGRMGSLYLLHLAEARAQRRRLLNGRHDRRIADQGLGMFLRLFGLVGIAVTMLTLLVLSFG